MDSSPAATENFDLRKADQYSLAVVGFPRTGTTFIQHAMQNWLLQDDRVFKNHDVLAIPEFIRAGIPVFVTLRDPFETCISWSYYNRDSLDKKLALNRIRTYVVWHSLLGWSLPDPDIHIVQFDEFTESLEHVTEELNTIAELNPRAVDIQPEAVRHHLDDIQRKQGTSNRTRNTPSAEHTVALDQYREIYNSIRKRHISRRAFNVYNKLTGS